MSGKDEKKRISIREIDHVLENAPGIFRLSDIAAQLNGSGDDELLKRLEHLIDGDVNYFHTDDWECELKMHYFSRIPFAVTPEKWEIEQGVLFPPGRLTPFLTEDVFPSDAELLFDDEPLPKREITLPFSEAVHYAMLIGHEEILDYLEADSDANENLREHLAPTTLVTMTVFDCRELFKELSFKEGDSLILQLTDPDSGEFELNYRPRKPEITLKYSLPAGSLIMKKPGSRWWKNSGIIWKFLTRSAGPTITAVKNWPGPLRLLRNFSANVMPLNCGPTVITAFLLWPEAEKVPPGRREMKIFLTGFPFLPEKPPISDLCLKKSVQV